MSNHTRPRRFAQVDVFTARPLYGNPVAVVLDGDGLSDQQMQAFANWTNLSETTFILQPTAIGADYRLRIFTPAREMPFAGHPTLGSCHAWLEAGGRPADADVVQECGVGLVTIGTGERLAFAAPPPRSMRPIDPEPLMSLCSALAIDRDHLVDHQVLDNGPVFHTLWLDDVELVRRCRPDLPALGTWFAAIAAPIADAPQEGPHLEVRMFAPVAGVAEDPVTGSLNAILAQWLIGAGHMPERYVAAQGAALGRAGRVHIATDARQVWVGGDTITVVSGTVTL
jgi:PhzF family phenazine biosynthesis protein